MEMSKSNSSHGFISLLYSISDNPLGLWSKRVSTNGCIRRLEDDELNGDRVIEITGPEDCPIPTNISCPANPEDFLNIRLPVLAIVLRDLDARVEFAFQLIDEDNVRRKFILSTRENEKTSSVETDTARIPLKLDDGWNLLEIDLRSLCRTTYRAEYRALQRLIIYPNCRLRRIYFQDRHYEINETPVELCQAFFDMYMLKWGIHFVERSCQTNELAKKIKSDEKDPISLPENRRCVRKTKNTKSFISEKLSPPTSKFPRVSTFKAPTKKKRNSIKDDAAPASERNPKFPQPGMRGRKKSNNEIRDATNPRGIASIPIIVDENFRTMEKEGEIFRNWPYNYVPPRKIDNGDAEAKYSVVNSFGENILAARRLIRDRLSSASLEPIAKIPSVVEAEASEAMKNVESTKSKLLTTDEAVGKFLELRHVVNEKMLENFRVRGMTMTEVELSIYNSKHRRNCYGQGKLVEKHRVTVDKACDVVPVNGADKKKKKASNQIKNL